MSNPEITRVEIPGHARPRLERAMRKYTLHRVTRRVLGRAAPDVDAELRFDAFFELIAQANLYGYRDVTHRIHVLTWTRFQLGLDDATREK